MTASCERFDSSLHYFVYRSPHGLLTIQATKTAVTRVAFGEQVFSGTYAPTELTNAAANQLMEYFGGKRFAFELPLNPAGSDFQKEVWTEIQKIPYGQARPIVEIARDLGKEAAYRSVGIAAKKSPMAIIIPTHRICAAGGRKLNATKANQFNAALLKQEERYLETR